MTGDLLSTLRRLVAEDLAANDDLQGEDRKEFARQRIFALLDEFALDEPESPADRRSVADDRRVAQQVLDALFGMGRLQALIDDPGIENIDINGCDRVWATFADGSKRLMPPIADSDEELVDLVRSAASRFGLSERRFDLARPELDLQPAGWKPALGPHGGLERPVGVDEATPVRRPLSIAELVGARDHDRRRGLAAQRGGTGPEEHRGGRSDELGKDDASPGTRRRDPTS